MLLLSGELNFTVSGGPDWKSRFSLNPPGGEFQLDRVAPEEIEKLLGKDCLIVLGQNKPLADALSNRSRQPIELFPWLMLLFVGVIVVESVMANRFYKPEVNDAIVAGSPVETPAAPVVDSGS